MKYNALLERLEVVELKLSQLENEFTIGAEFYSKTFIKKIKAIKLSKLPYHNLSQITEQITDGDHGKTEYQQEGVLYLLSESIKEGYIDLNVGTRFITKKLNLELKRSELRPNDIVLTKTGVYFGKSAVVPREIKVANTSAHVAKITPGPGINSYYLSTFFNSKFGHSQLRRRGIKVSRPEIKLIEFQDILVSIANVNFQDRIEETVLMAQDTLEKSKSTYQQAEALLLESIGLQDFTPSQENTNIKSFQDSFLSSGRLDAEYYQPKYEGLISSFSETVETKCIGEIQTFNRRGLQPIYVDEGEYDVINSRHIKEDHLDYDSFERTDERNFNGQSIAHVQQYDVLTYTTGAYVGRTNVYLKDTPALASNHVNILRLKNGYDPIYVGYVMNSLIGRMQTERVVSGSAQAELYPKDIASFIIPFPSKDVQNQIKDRIKQSLDLKSQSKKLLEVAKRAVEIAIEEDETAAMRYIEAET